MRRPILTLLAFLGVGQLHAQAPASLSVADAVAAARRHHPQLARARAEHRIRQADAKASLASYLPQVSTEWSLVRSDDPVAVFGTKLRQGRFGAGDFGVESLNHPDPVSNASIGLTVEQPLIAPQGWLGRRAARAGVTAGQLMVSRAEQLAAFDAVRTYFAVALAASRIEVLDSALAAARQTVSQVRSLRREGVVTAVDEQLALSRVSELEASRAMASAEHLALADQLLILMGEPPGQPIRLADTLAFAPLPADSTARLDLGALAAVVDAEESNLKRVKAQWLPSVGAFGTIGWNQGTVGAFAGPEHWTAGLMVRWTPFRGNADIAAVARARAGRDLAVDQLSAAQRSAVAEVRAADGQARAAEAALAAADRALESAAQSARIAASRYAGGVATISELLSIRAAESAQRLGRLDALYRARVAAASLALARGGDPQ